MKIFSDYLNHHPRPFASKYLRLYGSSPRSKGLSFLTQKVGPTFALSIGTDIIASLWDIDPYSGTEKVRTTHRCSPPRVYL